MKKKHRDITVNGIKYGWTVEQYNEDSSELLLKIWKDKKVIDKTVVPEDRDITPKMVQEIIDCI